jgi:hypothetical protein
MEGNAADAPSGSGLTGQVNGAEAVGATIEIAALSTPATVRVKLPTGRRVGDRLVPTRR